MFLKEHFQKKRIDSIAVSRATILTINFRIATEVELTWTAGSAFKPAQVSAKRTGANRRAPSEVTCVFGGWQKPATLGIIDLYRNIYLLADQTHLMICRVFLLVHVA